MGIKPWQHSILPAVSDCGRPRSWTPQDEVRHIRAGGSERATQLKLRGAVELLDLGSSFQRTKGFLQNIAHLRSHRSLKTRRRLVS